ncbi:family 16 glycosylhydrolase [Micromonosporaceae bacterium Da 78-11]
MVQHPEAPEERRAGKSRFLFVGLALLVLFASMLVVGPPQVLKRVVSALPEQSGQPSVADGSGSAPATAVGPAATATSAKPGAKPSASAGPTVAAGPATTGPNVCDNNLLSQNINGWGALDDAAVDRDPIGDLTGAAWAFRSAGTRFYMPRLDVQAGQRWVFAARSQVLNTSGTAQIAAEWYNSSDQFVGAEYGPVVTLAKAAENSGKWANLVNVFTVPFGATSAHVMQVGAFSSSSNTGYRSSLCDYRLSASTPSVEAGSRWDWGTPVASQSDEYNSKAINLSKWGMFGVPAGQRSGCAPGYNGNGQRCGTQTTQSGGYLTINGTADGKTGGLYSQMTAFRYGRVEIRQRSMEIGDNGGATYRTVPLLWPENGDDYENAEIDFAERELSGNQVHLFVHHGGQSHCRTNIDPSKFHTFAVDWRPSTISWYVDGALICTVDAKVTSYSSSNGGAQMDMFSKTGTLMQPARQDVDWIRMYKNKYTTFR